MEKSQDFEMDESAMELFEQFGGIDDSDRTLAPPKLRQPTGSEDTIDRLLFNLDEWRVYLIDVCQVISNYIASTELIKNAKQETAAYEILKERFSRFWQRFPGAGNVFSIHFKGESGTGGKAMASGYYVRFHNIEVDINRIPAISDRTGKTVAQLKKQLFDSLKLFAKIGVLTINVKMPEEFESGIRLIRDSLLILNRFFYSVRNADESNLPSFVIQNEWHQPEPNLTLMTALSGIDPDKMRALIQQLTKKMESSDYQQQQYEYLSVYDALLTLKNLPIKLVRPPVEINTLSSFLSSVYAPKVTKSTGLVVKKVMESYGKNPSKALRIMDTIYGDEKVYGNDFVNKDYRVLGVRISEADNLLNKFEDDNQKETFEKEVIRNIGTRLSKVNDEVLEQLFIPEEVAKIRKGRDGAITGTEIFRGIENLRLKKMIEYYRIRAYSRKKIKEMINQFVNLNENDYAILAKDFRLTRDQVKELLGLLQECFDENRKFRRKVFEANVAKFAKYEKSVFEFLWHYLKTLDLPKADRISFLNSLQLLIEKIHFRKQALRLLLSDVFRNPTVIEFYDRNAMILANLLLRKYNKEKLMDIEVTPEEVLLVEAGIDKDLCEYAGAIIDSFQEIFLIKLMTIQKNIKLALNQGISSELDLPFHFILSLEREIIAFFALVGGTTAQAVMRIAMKEYGDPDSDVYHMKYSKDYMPKLLQRLRLVVRGFGRVGEEKDLKTLNELKKRKMDFIEICGTSHNVINQIMEYADNSMDRIAIGNGTGYRDGWF